MTVIDRKFYKLVKYIYIYFFQKRETQYIVYRIQGVWNKKYRVTKKPKL